MQLPAKLKGAIDELLEQTRLAELEAASARLTRRYRAEKRDGTMHLNSRIAAHAYLAARLPATYAAVYSSLEYIRELIPDFTPQSQLDVGAGPGTALYAASQVFTSLTKATLVEQSEDIQHSGQFLSSKAVDFVPTWTRANITNLAACGLSAADLVTLAYVLDELEPDSQDHLIDALWQLTHSILVIVEPGTPAGWNRLMHQRKRLLDAGAYMIAPCPHSNECPVKAPDWCHFSVRVERSRLHRQTKQAAVPFEDEKFSYIAFSKKAFNFDYRRVLNTPRRSAGKIDLTMCWPNGEKKSEIVTKKNMDFYRLARRCDWGGII